MIADLATLLDRDLAGVQAQVDLYPDDKLLWRDVAACPNSGGTLALHVVGNLRHYVGAILGDTGYVRDREAEFSSRNVSSARIKDLIVAARAEVGDTLSRLKPDDLGDTYPEPIAGRHLSTGLWLLHLATHLAYHLGQIDYHRRIVTGNPASAGTVSARNLPEWDEAKSRS